MIQEIIAYIKSRAFLKNLGIAAASLFAGLIIIFIFIRIYTLHARAIAVPDFTDLPVEDARKIIEQRKLRFEIFDSLFVPEKEKGVVVDQHPKAGFLVKKNRIVYFTINATSPEKILMPDLVGITLREARAKIMAAGLKVGKFFYRFDLAKNVVLEQQFKGKTLVAGDTVLKGSEIDMVLGKGLSDARSMVPNLAGLTLDQAKLKASDAFFTLGAIISDETTEVNDTLVPRIYKQRPPHSGDVLIPLGSPIDIWLTLDSAKMGYEKSEDDADYVWPELNDEKDAQDNEEDSYNSDYN